MEIFVRLGLGVLAFVGLLMTSLGLPGNTLLLLLFLVFAFLGDFVSVTINMLGIVAFLYLLGEAWELVVGYLGIKKEKVTWLSVIIIGAGSFLGALAGTAVFPILGSVLGAAVGAFITAFLVEYHAGKGHERAVRTAWVAARNHFLGLIGKLAVGITIFIMFIYALFLGGINQM